MSQLINGYALALLSLAKEEKKLKDYKFGSLSIVEALEENHDYIHLLNSKGIEWDKREEMVKSAFISTEKNLVNFMLVLAQHGQAKLAVPVLKKLVREINSELGIKEGVVYSTEKLDQTQISKIENSISTKLGFKITLVNKLDAELISGIRVIVGDEIFEDSIVSRFAQIRNELLEREEN